MDRLTIYREGVAVLEDYDSVYADRGFKRGNAISKLSAYEDTGLEPHEVEALKADNERLTAELAHKDKILDEKDQRIAELERALELACDQMPHICENCIGRNDTHCDGFACAKVYAEMFKDKAKQELKAEGKNYE